MATTGAGLKKIAEGREAEIYEWEPGQVLRLFRGTRDGASLEREAAAMRAARERVPLVPAVLGTTEMTGRPGLIMERVDGGDLLTITTKKPWWLWKCGRITGETHPRLHDVVAPATLPALKQRIASRLASPIVPPHLSAFTLEMLRALPDGDRLCHGDFHPGNILISAKGPFVIDWPNATRSDPHADFARTRLILRMGELPPGSSFVDRTLARIGRGIVGALYARAYRRARPVDMALVARWEIVQAADRLGDQIPEERAGLIAMLEWAAAAPPI